MKLTIAILFIFISNFAIAKKNIIHIGYFISPPNIICEKDCVKPSGAVVDLLEDVYRDSPFTIKWERLPFLRLLNYLENGSIDAIALLGKTAERNQIYKYPSKPFHYIQAAIAVHKDTKITEIKNLSQVKGWQLTYTKNGLIPLSLQKEKINWINLSRPTFFEKGMKMTCFKRIDAVFYPVKKDLEYMVKNNNCASDLKVLKLPIDKEPLYTLFSKKSVGSKLSFYENKLKKILNKKSFSKYLSAYDN